MGTGGPQQISIGIWGGLVGSSVGTASSKSGVCLYIPPSKKSSAFWAKSCKELQIRPGSRSLEEIKELEALPGNAILTRRLQSMGAALFISSVPSPDPLLSPGLRHSPCHRANPQYAAELGLEAGGEAAGAGGRLPRGLGEAEGRERSGHLARRGGGGEGGKHTRAHKNKSVHRRGRRLLLLLLAAEQREVCVGCSPMEGALESWSRVKLLGLAALSGARDTGRTGQACNGGVQVAGSKECKHIGLQQQ